MVMLTSVIGSDMLCLLAVSASATGLVTRLQWVLKFG
jgi:hypothetical protein